MDIPLSNEEVLKVLKARENQTEFTTLFIDYIESVRPNKHDYPLETLRKVKSLESNIIELAMLSNTNDINTIKSHSDRKKIG
jgi:hypothetical protein